MMEKYINGFVRKVKEFSAELLKNKYLGGPRTSFLLILLMASICFSFIMNYVYKPQKAVIQKLKDEVISLENRKIDIESKIPDIEEQTRLVNRERIFLKGLKDELKNLERALPHQESLPGLLSDLFSPSLGTTIVFQSIKPIETEDKADYDKLNIEIRISTGYLTLVNYLRQLENFSQFIRISKIDIQEEDGLKQELNISMVLSALLGEKYANKMQMAEKVTVPELLPLEIKRNPFLTALDFSGTQQFVGKYVLQGAITSGKDPTVVINDNIYRIGDQIDNHTVKEISSEQVVLDDGQEIITLMLDEVDDL